jgi:exosortase/archaeosortase
MVVALGRLEILGLALRAVPEGEELLGEVIFQAGSGVAAEMVWPLLVRGAIALVLGLALRAYSASVKRRGNALAGAVPGVAAE